jgi:hypothetical protein
VSGCSSGVEHNLAKVGVEGSNPFARSKNLKKMKCLSSSRKSGMVALVFGEARGKQLDKSPGRESSSGLIHSDDSQIGRSSSVQALIMRAGIVVNVTRADRLRLEAIVADRSEASSPNSRGGASSVECSGRLPTFRLQSTGSPRNQLQSQALRLDR